MRTNQSGDTQPELDTETRGSWTGLTALADMEAPLGLQFVFPRLHPAIVTPRGGLPLLLGRDGQGEGRLDGTGISRRHAQLQLTGELRDRRLLVRDLGSRNGLQVNGQRCAQALLQAQDVIRLGEWVAVVVPDSGAGGCAPSGLALPAGSLHLGPTALQVAVRAHRLAASAMSLVLEGETGTGKEQFARAIHDWSGRRGPLVSINCAAVPEALAEAELFGYREGAFTGAVRSSLGHFRTAHGGTLFLDEVTDLPTAVQAKLLRALEQKEVLPVGESHARQVDVRVLAATQIPLERAVAERRLRADLHARLDGFTLRLPPLRERRVDIPSLFLHLLARHGLPRPALSPRLVEALCTYHWPLNVRELDFLAQRLTLLHASEPLLRRCHLPDRIRRPGSSETPAQPAVAELAAGRAPSRGQLLEALASAGGNLARAARELGISRQKVYAMLGEGSPERRKASRRPSIS